MGPGTRSKSPTRIKRPREPFIFRRPSLVEMSRGSSYLVAETAARTMRSVTVLLATRPVPGVTQDQVISREREAARLSDGKDSALQG